MPDTLSVSKIQANLCNILQDHDSVWQLLALTKFMLQHKLFTRIAYTLVILEHQYRVLQSYGSDAIEIRLYEHIVYRFSKLPIIG
jgi:hypothetical protein